jgi:hypothetical protein
MGQQYIESNVQKCYEFRKFSGYYLHHMDNKNYFFFTPLETLQNERSWWLEVLYRYWEI